MVKLQIGDEMTGKGPGELWCVGKMNEVEERERDSEYVAKGRDFMDRSID